MITFENYFNNKDISFVQKYNQQWKNKYPELKMFNLEYDVDNWLYSLNKTHDGISIDIFIEISYTKNWKIEFEMIILGDDVFQEEKHHLKSNITYDVLDLELSNICSFLRKWNYDYYKTNKFYPLVD